MADQPLTPDLIHDILGILDRHDYTAPTASTPAGPFCSSATWRTS
jgi:hypothetical protein